jgi:hypothetical protein
MYKDLGDKLFCFRLGFGWVFPIWEESRLFNVGIKLYLSLPQEKPTLMSSTSLSEGGEDRLAQPSILIPRKRSRGEQAVRLINERNVTIHRRARPSQLQPLAPMRADSPPTLTVESDIAAFQEVLLQEGCGTQVQTSYIYPFYTSGHTMNHRLFCNHVGAS